MSIKRFYKNNTSEIAKKIYNYASWSIGGTVVAKIVFVTALMIIARIVGKEHYGEFGIVNSTIVLFVSVTSFGIGATASKYIAEYRDNNQSRVVDIYLISTSFSILVGFAISLLIFLFSDKISIQFLHTAQLQLTIKLASLSFLVSIIDGSQIGVLSGFENFKSIAISNVIKAIAQFICTILGAYFYGVEGVILGFGIAHLTSCAYNFFQIRKHIAATNISIQKRFKELKIKDFDILWKFSLPTAMSSLVMLPIVWLAKTNLIEKDGFSAMANYEVADQWRLQIAFIPGILAQIILPLLSNSKNKSFTDFKKTIILNLKINLFVSMIVAALICLFAQTILLGYGSDFNNPIPIYLLAITSIFISISNVSFPIFMTYNKIWNGLLINIIWAFIFYCLSNYFIDNNHSENGLALAMLLSYIVSLSIQIIYIGRLLKNQNKESTHILNDNLNS